LDAASLRAIKARIAAFPQGFLSTSPFIDGSHHPLVKTDHLFLAPLIWGSTYLRILGTVRSYYTRPPKAQDKKSL
jgi:hypothetical protein